jgi:DNA-binding transcriptional MerR regulator
VSPSALRSGALARAAGVNRETLRYYERRGLLAEPVRGPGGHRHYPPEALDRLRAIRAAQRLGFTLDEIRGLLEPHGAAAGAVTDRARAKVIEIDRRIADLRAVRDALSLVVSSGCDSLTECTCPAGVQQFVRSRAGSGMA